MRSGYRNIAIPERRSGPLRRLGPGPEGSSPGSPWRASPAEPGRAVSAGRVRVCVGARWWAELSPAAGAAVMAAGIISAGLHLIGRSALSLAALAVSAALWLVLAADFTARLVGDRRRFRAEADTPAALTAVAATTVLGARLSLLGWQAVAAALLALAAALWPGLLLAVLRHWGRRMPGAAFLVCVATQGLAVLAGTLAGATGHDWLGRAALAAFCLGLLLYAEALLRFDFREVVSGAGDHWVAAWSPVHHRTRRSRAHRVTPVDGTGAHGAAYRDPGGPRPLPGLVRRPPRRRGVPAAPALRHPALVERLPARHDRDGLPLRGATDRRAMAAPAGRVAALGRGGCVGTDLRGLRRDPRRRLTVRGVPRNRRCPRPSGPPPVAVQPRCEHHAHQQAHGRGQGPRGAVTQRQKAMRRGRRAAGPPP